MPYERSARVAVGAAWVIFFVCCLGPLAWMLLGTVASTPSRNFSVLSAPRQWTLLMETLVVAGGGAATSFAIGMPLGVLLGRCNSARVQWLRLALTVPLVLPSYAVALAWVSCTDAYLRGWEYGVPAAVFVLGCVFYPLVMLATESSLRTIPAHLEEAGWLVASRFRVSAKIVLPLIAPSLIASTIVVFVLALSDYAIPSLLRVRVYATEVFTAFAALYDFQLAALTALPLAFVGAASGIAALEVLRRPLVARSEHGPTAAWFSDDAQQVIRVLLWILTAALVGIPVGAVVIEARTGRSLLAEVASVDAIVKGFYWAAAAATVAMCVGTVLGYWRARTDLRKAHMAEMLWAALYAVPSSVAGIGIIALWNRGGLLGSIYGSDAIVVLAYLSRYLPIAALLSFAAVRRVPSQVEEAAYVSGSSWFRGFRYIVLPLSIRGLAAAWFVLFILMFGDVPLAMLVAPPGESSLSVRAYTLIANSPPGDVARVALVQLGVGIAALMVIGLLLRSRATTSWNPQRL